MRRRRWQQECYLRAGAPSTSPFAARAAAVPKGMRKVPEIRHSMRDILQVQ